MLHAPTRWLNQGGHVEGNGGLALLILTRAESIASPCRKCLVVNALRDAMRSTRVRGRQLMSVHRAYELIHDVH